VEDAVNAKLVSVEKDLTFCEEKPAPSTEPYLRN
jgi:hypothetical protein